MDSQTIKYNKMEKYLAFYNDMKDILSKIVRTDIEAIKPATEEEIAALEKQLNVQLPMAYRAWLLVFGNGVITKDSIIAESFNNKTIWDALAACKEWELQQSLPNNYYDLDKYLPKLNLGNKLIAIFYMAENDVFVLLEKGIDNPKVYVYFGDDCFDIAEDTFTDYARLDLFLVLYYGVTQRKSEQFLTLFPWLDIYSKGYINFEKRREFLTHFKTIDATGRILGFEEVEMAFHEHFLKTHPHFVQKVEPHKKWWKFWG